MNILELFCGTKSIGKCCDKLGWNSVSVDMEKKFNPTHLCNIMDFDYKQYPKDYFDIVWSSPPCTEYSKAKSRGIRDIDGANKIVIRTIEIINYFNCEYWFMENPQSGRLKDRDIMKDLPYYDVDYCKYSDWGYRKRTRIWTNKEGWNNLMCKKDCDNIIDGLHKSRMGTSKSIIDDGKLIRVNTAELRKKYKDYKNENDTLNTDTTKHDRYRIPEDLIFSLFLE